MREKFPDNNFVPAKIGSSRRLFIAEAPGLQESETGEPLVGGAGRWLKNIARKAGLKWDTISKTNVIQCRPLNNLFPTDSSARGYISYADGLKAVQHCVKTHVAPLLRGRKWSIINFLGEKPLRWIGERTGGIFRWRGSPMPVPLIDPLKDIAVPTLHPAYIMRDQSMLPVVVNDLAKNIVKPPEHYIPFPSIEQVRAFNATRFAFDIETDPRDNYKTITMVGLCAEPYKAICVPFKGVYVEELKRIFRNAKTLIGHNLIAYDIPKLFPALGLKWTDEK